MIKKLHKEINSLDHFLSILHLNKEVTVFTTTALTMVLKYDSDLWHLP